MLQTTFDLLNAALAKQSASEWSRVYKIKPSAIAHAKKIKRLSPMLAGNLAMDLGEDAEHWATIAVIETERDSKLRERLRKKLHVKRP